MRGPVSLLPDDEDVRAGAEAAGNGRDGPVGKPRQTSTARGAISDETDLADGGATDVTG